MFSFGLSTDFSSIFNFEQSKQKFLFYSPSESEKIISSVVSHNILYGHLYENGACHPWR